MAATREIESQPRFYARISVSHLKPVETAIMGYFPGGVDR